MSKTSGAPGHAGSVWSLVVDLVAHVRALVAVVDEGGFTRAAEVLAVPQPVVSRRVAALERHLGGRLVTRGRRIEPTDLGRWLLPHARGVLGRVDQLHAAAASWGGELVLAVPPASDPRGLAELRAAVRDAAGGAHLALLEAEAPERTAALAAGDAHAAAVACPADTALLVSDLGAAGAGPGGARLHLDTLRRRGAGARATVLHLTREDDVPWVRDVVTRAAARAGLGPAQVRVETSRTDVLTEVHGSGDLLLCSAREAADHGLSWTPLAGLPGPVLRRGWRVAVSERAAGAERLVALLPQVDGPLARALGCEVTR
jgi:DNA-binding transcriptional LysR family regulator